MTIPTPLSLAKLLLGILDKDSERLERIDRYFRGKHDDPYMPAMADAEYRLLAKRAITNWMPLLVGTPTQAMYLDSFRRGLGKPSQGKDTSSAEMEHWQLSRLDARQAAVYRGALTYGHSFTLTEKTKKGIRTKGLSAMKTAALFEDPANDDTPYAAATVTRMPNGDIPGTARLFDGTNEYLVTFKSYTDGITCSAGKVHGAKECPVTRFAAYVDLEGRTIGVVEPMIPVQNRINQTVFDLLVAQAFASFKVRWVTGMAPPVRRDAEGKPILDEQGQTIPLPIDVNAKRFLFAEDDDVNFGSLDETPLGGFIESIDMSVRHLSALAQVPPHHLLGQIANLSAEALEAAETSLSRMVEAFRKSFGESWERVFRLAAEMAGDTASAEDFSGEVLWRDMGMQALGQAADGLGKLAAQLMIPVRGLWPRVPGVTKGELDEWEEMREEDDSEGKLANALRRAAPDTPASVSATSSQGATE